MTEPGEKSLPARFILISFAIYALVHITVSRFSAHLVSRDWGIPNQFIYLPVPPDMVADHEIPLLYVHHVPRVYPARKIDSELCGGPWPMMSIPMLQVGEPRSQLPPAR
jgi:hypothetical protein